MPVALNRGDRNLLLAGGGVFLLLVIGALAFTAGSSDRSDNPTTYSAGSTGAKAAYLLLQSSGYRVERWERPPGELSAPASSTLVLAEPFQPATEDERASIRRFLEGGGHVIATGIWGASFLSTTATPDPVGGLAWKRVLSASPSAVTRAAPAITLAPQASWNREAFADVLYANDDDAVVVRVGVGAGEALWWASATPLTNAGLREPGNLDFFLACLGPAQARRVLWDEYFHGRRRSLVGSALASPVKWLLVQLGVVALAVLVTFSRRSGPIVVPAVESRLSPLEFVRTLGALYQRAGAASVAVDIAYQRFRYWLTRRLAMPGQAPAADVAEAVRARWHVDDDALGRTLRACEAARRDPDLDPRTALTLIQALAAYAATFQLFGVARKENP